MNEKPATFGMASKPSRVICSLCQVSVNHMDKEDARSDNTDTEWI